MDETVEYGPSIEDRDSLVIVVEGLDENFECSRKAGHLAFVFSHGGAEYLVQRSRFDGEYGDICRMTRKDTVGTVLIPTLIIEMAAASKNPAEKLAEAWKAWRREKGDNK